MYSNPQHNPQGVGFSGAGGGGRTHNLRFRRPLLYPLSYARALQLWLPCVINYSIGALCRQAQDPKGSLKSGTIR